MALALALIVADSHFKALSWVRSTLSVLVYPVQYLAAAPSRLVQGMDGRLATEADLRERNAVLERENLELRGQLQTFLALQADNRRLRDLLGSSFKLNDRVLAAELLAVDLDPFRHQVMINKGSAAGVYVGQPVLDANAVMGQVLNVGPLTATVLLITDPSHSLPVQVNRNGLRTIATGSGIINQLNLNQLPKNADVREGDLLVTSGLGGVFPSGYPVARIVKLADDANSQFATVVAEPTARLDRVHQVLLVWTLPPVLPGGTTVTATAPGGEPAAAPPDAAGSPAAVAHPPAGRIP